ncbi:MAG: hypothetical protein WC314_09770 [Vulcanimicrobiota bacterium]
MKGSLNPRAIFLLDGTGCRYWAALSIWGVAYFLTEKLAILALVYLEWRILQSLENSEER